MTVLAKSTQVNIQRRIDLFIRIRYKYKFTINLYVTRTYTHNVNFRSEFLNIPENFRKSFNLYKLHTYYYKTDNIII